MRTELALVVGVGLAISPLLASCSGDEAEPTTTSAATSSSTSASGGGGTGGDGGQAATTGGGQGGTGGAACSDGDLDGQTDCAGDCDDADGTSFLGASEICGDGADNDCDNAADPAGLCQGIGTFVSALVGQDPPTGLGTQTSPVRTIAQGVANAQTIGSGVDVYVAEGTYPEKIDMIETIDLRGGFQCDLAQCTWVRDTLAHESVIANTDFVGVSFGSTLTRATTFEGFRVMGKASASGQSVPSSALTIVSGSPTITDNRIYGGAMNALFFTTAVRIDGLPNDPEGALVQGNLIDGGDGLQDTSAILIAFGSNAVAEIRGNRIVGGGGRFTRAVAAFTAGSGTVIAQNEIVAGTSFGAGGAGISVAMTLLGPTNAAGAILVDANRINADFQAVGSCAAQQRWCGGIQTLGTTATITNNVVYGMAATRSFGLYVGESEIPAGVVILNGNTIDGGGLFSGVGTSLSAAVVYGDVNLGTNVVTGRVRNNILLGGVARDRFGVYEDDKTNTKTSRPELLENNDLFFPTNLGSVDAAYRQWLASGTGVVHASVGDMEASLFWATANVAVDPDFGLGQHLLPGSPCIDAGTATEAPSFDLDGDARPLGGGIDIGADEAP